MVEQCGRKSRGVPKERVLALGKKSLMVKLAMNVFKLRHILGLTQEQAAEKAGIDNATFRRVETATGQSTKLDTLEALGKGLDAEPWELLK